MGELWQFLHMGRLAEGEKNVTQQGAGSPGPEGLPSRLSTVAKTLTVDAVTAELVEALKRAGIRTIVLKGPSVARWLYPEGGRTYEDTDLLLDPSSVPEAERVLKELGFEALGGGDLPEPEAVPHDRPEHSRDWRRARDGAIAELHFTLDGAGVEPDRVWEVLSKDADRMTLHGTDVETEILSEPARAMHLSLHVLQHGHRGPKALSDLRAGLVQIPAETWRNAMEVARQIGAPDAFAGGLSFVAEGRALAERLGLPPPTDAEISLRVSTSGPQADLALAFEWLSRLPDLRSKLAYLGAKVFPRPAYLRSRAPLARRGPVGLVGAYILRVVWIVSHAPAGFAAWRRARRRT